MSDVTSANSVGGEGAGLVNAPPPVVEGGYVPKVPSKFVVRMWCALVFGICGGMLGLGMWLTPDPRGYGTHQQLGLYPCGFMAVTGYPCPTCSCTTAVSHFSHGQFVASFVTQPFGFTVALVAAIAVMLTGMGLVTGRWYGPSMFILSWYWRVWLFGGIGILLAAWAYKAILVRLGHG